MTVRRQSLAVSGAFSHAVAAAYPGFPQGAKFVRLSLLFRPSCLPMGSWGNYHRILIPPKFFGKFNMHFGAFWHWQIQTPQLGANPPLPSHPLHFPFLSLPSPPLHLFSIPPLRSRPHANFCQSTPVGSRAKSLVHGFWEIRLQQLKHFAALLSQSKQFPR